MIELQMVRRMIGRGLWTSPAVAGGAYLFGGPRASLSALMGIALALANLWLAGRIIGGIAENRPELLMAAGLGSLVVGLLLVVASALILRRIDIADFEVAGVVFGVGHLVLVSWEAADAFLRIDPDARRELPGAARPRS